MQIKSIETVPNDAYVIVDQKPDILPVNYA